MSAVVTRIAPSPTGAMHIGNARSALFNWLYARHCGGTFLLRIEDTDRARSTEAAVQVIFDSLQWLGLAYDEAPVFQFARADRHRDVARELLDRGWAYRCWMTPEEGEEAKAAARAAGHALRSPWRDKAATPELMAQPHVVRFKTPNDGETVIEDAVRGRVAFPNKDLEDLVILRSDGTPTYNLAVTVDDHDMGVTHVIRGEEHLSNAGRQSLMYLAMGWTVPTFGHLPLILGDDGAKTLLDLPGLASFAMLQRPIHLDEKTRARLSEDAIARLERLRGRLSGQAEWTVAGLDELLKGFVADEGVKFGEVGPLLRGVLTGGNAAPDLASTLFALQREEALNMLKEIGTVDRIPEYVQGVKDRKYRLMGFGHRVYKNYDPRAKVMQETAHEVLDELGKHDEPLLKVAMELEKIALNDEYFVERKLYPNVDFYSGITLSAMGFPPEMFTVLFSLARTVGWVAQWREMIEDPHRRISRPRQLYTGETPRTYVPMEKRG